MKRRAMVGTVAELALVLPFCIAFFTWLNVGSEFWYAGSKAIEGIPSSDIIVMVWTFLQVGFSTLNDTIGVVAIISTVISIIILASRMWSLFNTHARLKRIVVSCTTLPRITPIP